MSQELMSHHPIKNTVDFEVWHSVADLIGRLAGKHCEIVLHDLADPVHSVIYVVNGHVTGRAVGQGFRHLVVEMLRNEAQNPEKDLLDDWWFEHEGKLIRSMTLLIRNAKGELAGALCVNQDVTFANQAFDVLKSLLPGLAGTKVDIHAPSQSIDLPQDNAAPAKHEDARETVLQTVFRLIDGIAKDARPEGQILSRSERLKVLEYMDSREVFLVKGSIERAAQALGISKVTVYSDLDALHRQKNKSS
ncbi:MAG: helix-turn-helix transcriptional regulator [Sutterellaceae bacterium]|nr:helix-turn-helix transcriptional regulator [Sutterellaceae bacterium]